MARLKPRRSLRAFDPTEVQAEIAALRNLGPRSAKMLAAVGIHTRDELVRLGALGACARLFAVGQSVSLNLAYAIEGALMDCDWRQIPHDFRLHLAKEFRLLKQRHHLISKKI